MFTIIKNYLKCQVISLINPLDTRKKFIKQNNSFLQDLVQDHFQQQREQSSQDNRQASLNKKFEYKKIFYVHFIKKPQISVLSQKLKDF